MDVSFPTFLPILHLSVLTITMLLFRYNPISISEFNTTIYSILFKSEGSPTSSDEPDLVVSHRLSVMFMVLAVGSPMDTRLPSYNIEAEKYHQLARATLFQNSVFDEPNLGAVQALFLVSFYLFFSDRYGTTTTGGSRWATMGMVARIAQSVSLLTCGRMHSAQTASSLAHFQIGLREPCYNTHAYRPFLRERFLSLQIATQVVGN